MRKKKCHIAGTKLNIKIVEKGKIYIPMLHTKA
jgi:hypothetical protein